MKKIVQPAPSLLRSSAVVATMTSLSRILGFVRDVVIAYFFGASAELEAFLVAFKIPNFMRRLFAEGAFSQAFVPVLSEYQQQRSQSETQQFIARISGTLALVLLVVTVLAVLAAPILIHVFAPGFASDSPRFIMASHMLRLTFPYLFFISLTAMAGAVLNTYRSFAVSSFTPVLLNVSLISATIFGTRYFSEPVIALAWGVLIAGIVQYLFQLPFLQYKRLLFAPKVAWRDPGVRRVLKLMGPAIFGVSVAQINLMLDVVFASFLPVGSISWLYYSDRLVNFPLGVFGVAIATVILPSLSRQRDQQTTQQFSLTLDWALRTIFLIALPAALGLFFLDVPLLASLFGNGQFGAHDVLKARLSLSAFAIGVPFFMIVKILAASFYAHQDIKTPVKIGVIAMLSNVLLNIILIKPFAHMGLALATTLASIINVSLLWYVLRKRQITSLQPGWWRYIWQLVLANGMMLLWLLWWHYPSAQWLVWAWQSRVLHLLMLIIGGILIYLFTLRVTGVRFRDFRARPI